MKQPTGHPPTILLFLPLMIVSLLHPANAQGLDWGKLEPRAQIQWEAPTREFGDFWKNGPGIGVAALIPLDTPFHLSGSGTFSWFGRRDTDRKEKIPNIVLFRLGLAVQATLFSTDVLSSRLGLGLDNHTFIFVGHGAPGDIDNVVELEFGMNASIIVIPGFLGNSSPELMAQFHTIFTGPDRVGVVVGGILIPL